jgi:hypothetical protein
MPSVAGVRGAAVGIDSLAATKPTGAGASLVGAAAEEELGGAEGAATPGEVAVCGATAGAVDVGVWASADAAANGGRARHAKHATLRFFMGILMKMKTNFLDVGEVDNPFQ